MNVAGWRPTASVEVLHGRADMLARIRAYFAAQGVHEVQTPVLSASAVSDPQIETIAATPARGPRLFLQTSPEYPMKRLLAGGFGDCYQVCPVFRDGESGRLHNPEFTMIEWYRVDFGMAEMQHDVDRVLRVACAEVRSFAPTQEHLVPGRSRQVQPASIVAAPRRSRSALRWRAMGSSRSRPTTGIAMPGSTC